MTPPPEPTRFRVLLDAGVPDSVGKVLAERGHEVVYHRQVLPERTLDQVVAATALANNAILVAIDHDMREMSQRYGVTPRGDRFARLSIIRLLCNEVLASKRVSHVLTLIEHEWAISQEMTARRMWIDLAA